jgi:hypothetical protein
MVELEEEAGCYTAKKEAHIYHHSVMPCSWPFGEAVHNSPRVARIFRWAESCVAARPQLLRLGAQYWLGAPNGWDTTGRPQVIGRRIRPTRRSYLHPQIRIEIQMGRRIVPISLPQPAIIGLLKKNHHIQFNKNNNWRDKMVEQTYHKMLSAVVNELLRPLLAVLTPHVRLNKQLHWARLMSKRRSL